MGSIALISAVIIVDNLGRLGDVHSRLGGLVVETVTPRLRVVSSFAEGANRLVADAVTDLGFKLDVALSFERVDYAADFEVPGSSEAFDSWFEGPPVRLFLELDGPTGRESKNNRVIEDNLA